MTEYYTVTLSFIRKVFITASILATTSFILSCTDNNASSKHQHTGDFERIIQSKQLRVLIPRTEGNLYLPRQGYPLDTEIKQLEEFAHLHKLSLKKIYVPDFSQLIPSLIDGYGDIISANMTVTNERKDFIDYSLPNQHVKQQILQRTDDVTITQKSALKGKIIAIKPSSSFWPTAQNLKDKYPSIKLLSLNDGLEIEDILDRLTNKEFDITIQDTNVIDSIKTYRSDIKSSLILTKEQPVAWGIRQESPALKKALNKYIQQHQLRRHDSRSHTSDLKDIKKRKVIRMITRNNAANYFLYKGQLLGFEYELAQQFANKHRLNLEIIVAPDNATMLDWLIQGKGDFIAASLSPTVNRLANDISFSRHYLKTTHHLIQRPGEAPITTLAQLNNRSVALRQSSSYMETLEHLRQQGININVEFVSEDLETEDIINRVAIGQYDLTIADKHILDLELLWRDDIKSSMVLSDTKDIAWITRTSNPQLLSAINSFHRKNYKSLTYNLTYQKYFVNPAHRLINDTETTASSTLSPYDELVKQYATQYGFDWKLITAQMYQESRFNPAATSWVGAKGLLQVMPQTAEEFGFTDLEHPETGLHAGIKYMQWVQQRFDHELPVKDRMWFTLAAYNAGVGHVRDAISLARRMGWNTNRWFNNVEKAMLLLRLKKYYRNARFGFVRGREPVQYVRNIKHRYDAYNRLSATQLSQLPYEQ
ncbi:MAG: transporter substrate-binding domain-containing protein [Gammaproteobacteria bacterium]|nr:transporter substrate-binding domain-containing protein [Gammaproteobacteria bacterium]